jgi:hypothetical protein
MYVCICARQAREAADRDLRALLDAARADAARQEEELSAARAELPGLRSAAARLEAAAAAAAAAEARAAAAEAAGREAAAEAAAGRAAAAEAGREADLLRLDKEHLARQCEALAADRRKLEV